MSFLSGREVVQTAGGVRPSLHADRKSEGKTAWTWNLPHWLCYVLRTKSPTQGSHKSWFSLWSNCNCFFLKTNDSFRNVLFLCRVWHIRLKTHFFFFFSPFLFSYTRISPAFLFPFPETHNPDLTFWLKANAYWTEYHNLSIANESWNLKTLTIQIYDKNEFLFTSDD